MNFNKPFPQCGHENECQNRDASPSSRKVHELCLLLLLSLQGTDRQVISNTVAPPVLWIHLSAFENCSLRVEKWKKLEVCCGNRCVAPSFLTPVLDSHEWSASRFYHSSFSKRNPHIYWIGGWRGGAGGKEYQVLFQKDKNHLLLPRLESHTVQPMA